MEAAAPISQKVLRGGSHRGYSTAPRVPVEVKSARVTISMPWLHNLHIAAYILDLEFKILPSGATTS